MSLGEFLAPTTRRGTTYLPTLDGWRAVAIALVILCHLSVGIGLGRFKEVGLFGVQIFFGLSGFLITALLLATERKSGISLRHFYTRRVFRILPAALVFLCVIGALSIDRIINVSASRWLSVLFFMANYSKAPRSWYVAHFWSLAVEEHFYLILPAVLLFVSDNRKRLLIALSAAFLVALWRAIDFKYHLTWTDSAWFWGRTDINADSILLGVIYALAFDRLQGILSHPLASPISIGVFLLTIPSYRDWKIGFALLTVRAAIVPAMILSTMLRPQGHLGTLLELRPMRFIGVISYSLYLWQQLFVTWEPQFAVQRFPMNVLAAILCASLSFYFVEMPMIALGRKARMRMSYRASAAI